MTIAPHNPRRTKRVHRSPSYTHNKVRILKKQKEWEEILFNCEKYGLKPAFRMQKNKDGGWSLSTIKRRWRVWNEEKKEEVPLEKRKSTYQVKRTWNCAFTEEGEKLFKQQLMNQIDSEIELVDVNSVKSMAKEFHNLDSKKKKNS